MSEPGYSLTGEALRRVGGVVRHVEDTPRFGRGPGVGTGQVVTSHVRGVRVTGALSGNYYPGVVVFTHGDDATKEDAEFPCWIWSFSGAALSNGTEYLGLLTGEYSDRPVFLVTAVGGGLSGADVYNVVGSPWAIPNNAWTAIDWEYEVFDTDGYWSGGTSDRFVFPSAGVYEVGCSVEFYTYSNANEATGDRGLRAHYNGAVSGGQGPMAAQLVRADSARASLPHIQLNVHGWAFPLAAGDEIYFQVFHNVGAGTVYLNNPSASNACHAWVRYLGAY